MKNQNGFSLTELMIAVGILGGVSYAFMRMMDNQNSSMSYTKTSQEITKAMALVENSLNNPDTCAQILGGKTVSTTLTPIGTNGAVDTAVLAYTNSLGAQNVLLGENDYGSFSIADNAITLKESSFGANIADLTITFRMDDPKLGSRTIAKTIPIVVSKTGATISACGPAIADINRDSKESLCIRIGAAASWDSVTKKCRFVSSTCPAGQLVTGITQFGTYTCGSVVTRVQANLADYFDTSAIDCTGKNNIRVTNTSGKYKLECP